MKTSPKSFKAAAEILLKEADRPMKSDEITQVALDRKLIKTKGKTPAATMAAQLAVDVARPDSNFNRTAPATYGLKRRHRKGQKPKG